MNPDLPLVFGCAPAGGKVDRKTARRAMDLAFELGVSAFDTARSYGYGESEEILGEFARGKRDRVQIFSKAGIRSTPNRPLVRLAKSVARAVFAVAPGLRRAARGALGAQNQGGHFKVDELRESVTTTLTSLGTDHLDVLFLHDAPASLAEAADVFELLERFVQEGKVQRYGVSGAAADLVVHRAARPGLLALQYAASDEAAASYPSAFPPPGNAGVLRLGNRVFADLEKRRARGEADAHASCLLRPLETRRCDAVVVSMYAPRHIEENVRIVSEYARNAPRP